MKKLLLHLKRALLTLVFLACFSLPSFATMEVGTNLWNWSWTGGWRNYVITGFDWTTGSNPWQQQFLDEMATYSHIRFMDFNAINNSNIVNWSERVKKTDDHYATGSKGIAIEWMIDLCNRTNKHMWICVPAKANEDYIIQLATLIKNNLKPELMCFVEYSNETWNGGFGQAAYCNAQGVSLGLPGSNDWYKGGAFSVYSSLKVFKGFQDVFGAAAMGTRVQRVCSWSGNYDIAKQAFNNVLYSSTWNPTGQMPDYGAIAPYIGNGIDGAAPDVAAQFRALVLKRMEQTNSDNNKRAREICAAHGMKLCAYEGGQHLLLNAHIFSANPEIYDEYMFMLDSWNSEGFNLFMHYAHLGGWGTGGAWGAKTEPSMTLADAHKWRALKNWVTAHFSPSPVIQSPATTTVFSPGSTITANGSGNNLTWKISSIAAGTIKTGAGASITFSVPLTAADNSKIKVELTGGDAGNEVVFNEYTVLDDTPVITNPISGSAVINQPFSLQLVATGNGTPFTWSSTTLPAGMSISTDGLLSGTFTSSGTRNLSVKVTDADGDYDNENISVEVLDAPPCSTPGAFLEADGEVVMEAEHYFSTSLNGDLAGANWVLGTTYGGFSDTGYMGMPDANLANAASWAASSELSYKIQFNTTGTYNIWLRKYSPDGDSDSGNLGLDGVQLGGSISNGTSTSVWGWDKHATTFNITASPTVKTFNIRRREDGYSVDKIIITTKATTPTGNGPIESNLCQNIKATTKNAVLSIYPNPANKNIRISNSSLCDQVIIYDVLSREQVNAKVNGEGQIDISSLSPNIYMVRLLKDGKVILTQKLLKK